MKGLAIVYEFPGTQMNLTIVLSKIYLFSIWDTKTIIFYFFIFELMAIFK